MAAHSALRAILRDAPSALLRMRSQHRRPVQPEVLEQIGEGLQPLAAVRLHIEPFVIQKPRAIAQTAAALHVALDDLRRGVALAAERAGQIAARVIENVAAAEVDEFEHAERREADAEAVF